MQKVTAKNWYVLYTKPRHEKKVAERHTEAGYTIYCPLYKAKLNGNAPVELWGSGSPMREFLHLDDLGQAVLFALRNKLDEYLYNVGTGVDLRIEELAELIKSTVGHHGEIVWDNTKPDGTPRKLMDNSKINLQCWKYQISLS